MKRVFDIVLSLSGLMLLAPVLIFIGVMVKATSPGPAFYRGGRVGRLGKSFRIFKFRSMVANAETLGGSSTADDDMRITWFGRLLRKSKLDEIPQLLNVLWGHMSLVGPRPEVQEYVDMYTDEEQLILSLRPGITDWASIWNSDEGAIQKGTHDPDRVYLELIRPTKLKLQLLYARKRNVWVDCTIICFTLLKLVRRDDRLPAELESFERLTPTAPGVAMRKAA